VVNALLSCGASAFHENSLALTPLFDAVTTDNVTALLNLLRCGVDANYENQEVGPDKIFLWNLL
jgi:hypothetical protein